MGRSIEKHDDLNNGCCDLMKAILRNRLACGLSFQRRRGFSNPKASLCRRSGPNLDVMPKDPLSLSLEIIHTMNGG